MPLPRQLYKITRHRSTKPTRKAHPWSGWKTSRPRRRDWQRRKRSEKRLVEKRLTEENEKRLAERMKARKAKEEKKTVEEKAEDEGNVAATPPSTLATPRSIDDLGHNRTSSAAIPPPISRQASTYGFKPTPSGLTMGNFSTPTSKMTSEERFAAAMPQRWTLAHPPIQLV